MKRFLSNLPVILGILMVFTAIFLTGGFTVANPALPAPTEETPIPSSRETSISVTVMSTQPSSSKDPSPPSRTMISQSTEPSFAETTSRQTTTMSSQSTSKASGPVVTGPKGKYSSIRVFLDLQRIIFYKVDPQTGQEYEAYAIKCSTGTRQYPTPATGLKKPFILNGHKARLTIFDSTKSTVKCWVRYATHIQGSYWFHSVPYDYLEDSQGKPKFDPSRCYMYSGYDVLGSRTSSHGCIRLALRDANFLFNNSYGGMPCYILSSYSEAYPGRQPLAAATLPPALKGPRNWDPTDPDWQGYKTPSLPDPAPPPSPTGEETTTTETTAIETTMTETTTIETTVTATIAESTLTQTLPEPSVTTTEETPSVTTTLPVEEGPGPEPVDPPQEGAED